MTSIEKETIILFNEHESTARVETFNGRLLRSLRKLAGRDNVICEIDTNGYGVYTLPKALVKIHVPRIKQLTHEERAKLSEHMKQTKPWEFRNR